MELKGSKKPWNQTDFHYPGLIQFLTLWAHQNISFQFRLIKHYSNNPKPNRADNKQHSWHTRYYSNTLDLPMDM